MADRGVPSLAAQLEQALALIAQEAPLHFAVVRRQLGRLTAVVRVGADPPLSLCVAGGPPWVGRRTEGEISLALSAGDLSRLLRGELTVDEGILNGKLSARGALDHLLAFLDGLSAWLHGALRCPSLPKLYERTLDDLDRPTCSDLEPEKGRRPC